MKNDRNGFSLIEIIVVCSLLGLVVGGSFYLFKMGTRGFSRAINEGDALSALQRTSRVIQRDVRLTHFISVTERPRSISTADGTFSRDGLAVAGLSNWADPNNFEPGTELPNWNRWIIFYADSKRQAGLHRLELDRSPPSVDSYYPLALMTGMDTYLIDDPLGSKDVIRVNTLCHQIQSFSAQADPYDRLVNFKLVLYRKSAKRMTSETRVEDLLEAEFRVSPLNSYPEL